MFDRVDHVGIAVKDLDAAIAFYEAAFGVKLAHRETVEEQGVEEAMFRVGESWIQLLRPLGPDTPVGKYIEKRGEGVPPHRVRRIGPESRPGAPQGRGDAADRRRASSGFARIDGRVRPSAQRRRRLVELVQE